MSDNTRYERIAVFVFGVIFVTAILILATLFPNPTNFQYTVFRIVLALAAAGVAAFVPGFLHVDINRWLRAGGAMAVFVIVYFYSPAQLVYQPEIPRRGEEIRFITEDMIRSPPIGSDTTSLERDMPRIYNVYFTLWNKHPYESVRVSAIELYVIAKEDQIAFCCPETRSLIAMNLRLDRKFDATPPLQTTFQIPPLSSHAFESSIEITPGSPDRMPAIWFSLVVSHTSSEGKIYRTIADKAFFVNPYLLEGDDANIEGAYSVNELSQFKFSTRGDEVFGRDEVTAWLQGKIDPAMAMANVPVCWGRKRPEWLNENFSDYYCKEVNLDE